MLSAATSVMPFNSAVRSVDGAQIVLPIAIGETSYLLGPNGSGKSALLQSLYTNNSSNAKRIIGHRQLRMNGGNSSISGDQRRSLEANYATFDTQPDGRWSDPFSDSRPSIALFDMIEADNARARHISEMVLESDSDALREFVRSNPSKLDLLNGIFRSSNLQVQFSLDDRSVLSATRDGIRFYDLPKMSDGERSALLLVIDILTAKPATLILIDEPERHLNRAIVAPVIARLTAMRDDCAFLIATHDLELPTGDRNATIILIRQFTGPDQPAWGLDIVSPSVCIDDAMKVALLGSRRKALFIEGADRSLDKALYTLLFPGVSLHPKAGCREVIQSVATMRALSDLNWTEAYGIIDSDTRQEAEISELKARGIHALPVYSVESILYGPFVTEALAQQQFGVNGREKLATARVSAINSVRGSGEHLASRLATQAARESVFAELPTAKDITDSTIYRFEKDFGAFLKDERQRFADLVAANDLDGLLARYPLRESQALDAIAKGLGFANRQSFEESALTLIGCNAPLRMAILSLFGDLPVALA